MTVNEDVVFQYLDELWTGDPLCVMGAAESYLVERFTLTRQKARYHFVDWLNARLSERQSAERDIEKLQEQVSALLALLAHGGVAGAGSRWRRFTVEAKTDCQAKGGVMNTADQINKLVNGALDLHESIKGALIGSSPAERQNLLAALTSNSLTISCLASERLKWDSKLLDAQAKREAKP